MREIKFRIWDGQSMSKPDGWLGNYDDLYLNELNDLLSSRAVKEWKFLQSTGLKDKNGFEVFEGDIIKVDKEVVESIGEPEIVSVVYDEERAAFFTSEHRYLCLVINQSSNCGEVIGNIYMNPELIDSN